MVPKVQATSPVSDPRVFVRSLGQARLCARGAVRGADPLPLAAQGAAARGGRAGRLGSIKPPRPHGLPRFPVQRGRRGDPLGKRWDRGRSQDAAETPPWLLSGPGPSPPRPALRPGGGGADKGSRTALPAPEGGGGPRTHPPVERCRAPRASCCIHADTDAPPSRQLPPLPGVLRLFIVDGRATLALTTPWRGDASKAPGTALNTSGPCRKPLRPSYYRWGETYPLPSPMASTSPHPPPPLPRAGSLVRAPRSGP